VPSIRANAISFSAKNGSRRVRKEVHCENTTVFVPGDFWRVARRIVVIASTFEDDPAGVSEGWRVGSGGETVEVVSSGRGQRHMGHLCCSSIAFSIHAWSKTCLQIVMRGL